MLSVDADNHLLTRPRANSFIWILALFAFVATAPQKVFAGSVHQQRDLSVLDDNNISEEIIVLDDDDLEETTLVVRHKLSAPLSPSSRIIKADEFRGKFSDLPSVLETVSGINTRSMGGYGQYAEAAIRGGSAKGLRVYLDGVLLSGASTGAADLSKIPLDRISEIRVTKNTSSLRQMGGGMGGVIELFTDTTPRRGGNLPPAITGINTEIGSYGYAKAGAVIRRSINKKIHHQINIDAANSNNDYPFTHDNGTTIPTIRDPDPTWDDTLMRKGNNRYRSIDVAYGLSADVSERHKITQQASVNAFDQGLFVYHYKDDQSGSTSGSRVLYGIDYQGELTPRLTIGSEASGIYRYNAISDPDGHFSLGGAGRELESDGWAADFLADARYLLMENFYLSVLTGTRFERYVQNNKALADIDKPVMSRYEYKVGAEIGLMTGMTEAAGSSSRNPTRRGTTQRETGMTTESILRAVCKYEIDTTTAGLGYWSSDGKRYALASPLAEAIVRLSVNPVTLRLSAAASKRSPAFFERFGWSGGFLSNPELREETRMEADVGISVDKGEYGAAVTVFGGQVFDKIKSIPQNSFVKVMNFADTEFYGAEAEAKSVLMRVLTVELSAAWMRSAIVNAADPGWAGKIEPFVPELSGFLKTEVDIWKISAGHGIKYEGECYLNIENRDVKPAQLEFSAWAGFKLVDFLTVRYRVDNYLNSANFDFLDNPMPRRTHVLSVNFNFY